MTLVLHEQGPLFSVLLLENTGTVDVFIMGSLFFFCQSSNYLMSSRLFPQLSNNCGFYLKNAWPTPESFPKTTDNNPLPLMSPTKAVVHCFLEYVKVKIRALKCNSCVRPTAAKDLGPLPRSIY